MGCDIHTRAEVYTRRRYDDVEDQWHAVKRPVFPNDYYTEGEPIDAVSAYASSVPFQREPYRGRDYNLFAILANVRNDGDDRVNIFNPTIVIKNGSALLPIDQPRGIPDDASQGWAKECKQWGQDFHSASYFTLPELIAAREGGAFKQPIMERGYVGITAYRELKETGAEPQMWAGWSSDGITEDEYLDKSDEAKAAFTGSVATEWPRIVDREDVADEIIRRLTLIAPLKPVPDGQWLARKDRELDLDRVRMVFAFDN